MSDMNYKSDVLIVGAGPVGLCAAILLQKQGIKHHLIEKRSQRQGFSKAFAIHSRTLEVFEDIGVLPEIMEKCFPVEDMNIYSDGKKLISYSYKVMDIPYRYAVSIPQSQVESILTNEYQKIGGRITEGIELVKIEELDSGVKAHKVRVDTSVSSELEGEHNYRYLLACDGFNSQVRNMLDIPFSGFQYPTPYIIADGVLDWDGDLSTGHVHVAGGGYVMFFPLPEGRCRVVVDDSTGKLKPEDLNEELVNACIREKGITTATFSDSVWLTVTKFNRKLVDTYQVGNIFLAGDACHVHSPFGGQGLNTGIQDAYNIAWKLAHKVKFNAADSLLESYNIERRPVAEVVLQKTDQQMKMLAIRNPIAKAIRNTIVPRLSKKIKFQEKIVTQISGFFVDYRNSNIIVPSVGNKNIIAGDRMVDHMLKRVIKEQEPNTEDVRIFDVLAGSHYSLFLIGNKSIKNAAERLSNVFYNQRSFCRFYGVSEASVLEEYSGDTSLFFDDILFDEGDKFKNKYAINNEEVILVRPDGYIALRCKYNEINQLNKYMSDLYAVLTNEMVSNSCSSKTDVLSSSEKNEVLESV